MALDRYLSSRRTESLAQLARSASAGLIAQLVGITGLDEKRVRHRLTFADLTNLLATILGHRHIFEKLCRRAKKISAGSEGDVWRYEMFARVQQSGTSL